VPCLERRLGLRLFAQQLHLGARKLGLALHECELEVLGLDAHQRLSCCEEPSCPQGW
jgi:hypothetical protein